MNTSKVNRFEIIDHSPCEHCHGAGRIEDDECELCYGAGCIGRTVITHNPHRQIDVELQDDGRTLKVFIHERYED